MSQARRVSCTTPCFAPRGESWLCMSESRSTRMRAISPFGTASSARDAARSPDARDRQVRAERPLLQDESRRAQPPGEARGEVLQLPRALLRAHPQDAGPPSVRERTRTGEGQIERWQCRAGRGGLPEPWQGVLRLLSEKREGEVQLVVLRPGERRIACSALHRPQRARRRGARLVGQRNAEEEPHGARGHLDCPAASSAAHSRFPRRPVRVTSLPCRKPSRSPRPSARLCSRCR